MSARISKTLTSRAALHMDTVVSLHVVSSEPAHVVQKRLDQALLAFQAVERVCSRFSPESELCRLSQRVGEAVPVSPLLFESLWIAWEIADLTEGVFDPTIGHKMEANGFNRNYLTGEKTTPLAAPTEPVTYRDLVLDESARTVLLQKPLQLDLGAVAKGLAVDLATRELRNCPGFLINAGGDLYAGGRNEHDEPWRIDIQHPTRPDETITSVLLEDQAVCTSGSYERISSHAPDTHHLLDPHTGTSPQQLLSCSVIAPFAMLADACSTAAFLLGADRGANLLESLGLRGIFVTPDLTVTMGKEEPE